MIGMPPKATLLTISPVLPSLTLSMTLSLKNSVILWYISIDPEVQAVNQEFQIQKILGAFFDAKAPKNRTFRSNSLERYAFLRDFRFNPLRGSLCR
jgi:hypothetical protein